MRVLVTGSAGFVGRHVMSALLRAGHQVQGIDRRASRDRWSVRADLRRWCANTASPPSFDACIHLASDVGGFLHNATATEQVAPLRPRQGRRRAPGRCRSIRSRGR